MYQIMVLKLNFGLTYATLSRVERGLARGAIWSVLHSTFCQPHFQLASSLSTVEKSVFSSMEALALH